MPATLEAIFLEDTDTEEEVVISVNGGVASVEDMDILIDRPLLYRTAVSYDSKRPDNKVNVSMGRMVPPSDPRFALALQDHLPDGVLVSGAQVSSKRLDWKSLLALAEKLDG